MSCAAVMDEPLLGDACRLRGTHESWDERQGHLLEPLTADENECQPLIP